MAREGGMQGLDTLVGQVYPGRAEPDDVHARRLLGAWRSVVPERVWTNARPVRYQRGTLTVHTVTAAWANALQMDAETLLARLRRAVPHCRVRSLRFRVGRLPEPGPDLPARPKPFRLVPVRELPESLARELARIHDDELRDAVARAAAAGLARKKFTPSQD